MANELARFASYADAEFLQRYFKTGKGEYGEGDRFIGVRVPATRKVCHRYIDLPLAETRKLLESPVHEHRLAGAILLSSQYEKSDEETKHAIYSLYMAALQKGNINNWDIVDTSCAHIVGEHHRHDDRTVLHRLARSSNLWERRVAIISTFAYIKTGDASTTLQVSELLLHDRCDLIHKAVGWALREVGKRVDPLLLTGFLDKHAANMPRTMLRYACEKLGKEQRDHYYGR